MKIQTHNNSIAILCIAAYTISSCATASKPNDPCESAHNQVEMTACWSTQAKEAITVMNARYNEVLNAADSKKGPELTEFIKQSQAAWEQYKQIQCKLEAMQYDGGSAATMTKAICEERLAKTREQELRAIQDTGQ